MKKNTKSGYKQDTPWWDTTISRIYSPISSLSNYTPTNQNYFEQKKKKFMKNIRILEDLR